MQLQIIHTGYDPDNKPLFQVSRMGDGKFRQGIVLRPPVEVPVVSHNLNLRDGLNWYLEEYLDLAVGPYRTQADDICKTLDQWGEECFERLFGSAPTRDWYSAARQAGLMNLSIKIQSDDPKILSWPWEALKSPEDGNLALHCHIERQVSSNIGDPVGQSEKGQTEQINILYIIARPKDNDVGYSVLARPFIDYVREKKLPVHIDILRPPTFDRLREVLKEKQGFYHIVHFDGHGGYVSDFRNHASDMAVTAKKFSAPEGVLLFEEDGAGKKTKAQPGDVATYGDAVNAVKLGELLREYSIPVMVLNACQSAMLDEHANDPFASVAASLLHAGIRSVVAMSYSLYVSGARQFVPAFYERLFESGNVAEAMRAGRQEMYSNDKRVCFTGTEGLQPLRDWLVPVLYQQLSSDEKALPTLQHIEAQESDNGLPPEACSLDIYGFIGRDREIQALERALRRPQAGILIHGMAGEGKTTLIKGFLQWLNATHGLGMGVFWFSFEDIHSVDYVVDILIGSLFETNAIALPTKEKVDILTHVLRENPLLIVWDNFESASGIAGTEVSALMPDEDRMLLKKLLHNLRGGKTKVLITSRSKESWLAREECYRIELGGLQSEELGEYCNAVAYELELKLEHNESYRALMKKLEGNPLAVRAILARLSEKPAEALLEELNESFKGLEGETGTARIQAALAVFEKGLDRRFAPILQLLGLHEHYTDADYISYMLQGMDEAGTCELLESCFSALEAAGLCRPVGNNVYQTHPALRGCLTRLYPANECARRAFVKLMGRLANAFAPKGLHEQRMPFILHGANFHRALRLARELDMRSDVMALTQGLAIYAQNTRNFSEAERLYLDLAEAANTYENTDGESGAFHQLGMVAEERRDFDAAEDWYQKSLAIKLKLGNVHGAAITYHQLGKVAQARRQLDAAEDWYQKSLAIELKQGNERGAAITYHQLGSVAEARRDFDAAEDWYQKSLVIELKQGNERGAASTYHQLGMVAEDRREFDAAEDWYQKSLAIKLKQGNEYGAASTYHQLGMVAEDRRDFDAAEDWYKKSLAIKLKQCNVYGAAITYHQLGMVAQERRDFDAAEDWYQKSLAIKLKQGNEHDIAITYYQLGMVAEERRDFDSAEDWYRKALTIVMKFGDEYGLGLVYYQLGMVAEERRDFDTAEDWYQKSLIIKLKQSDEYGVAGIYHQMGIVAQERRSLDAAEDWYRKSLAIKLKQDNEYGAAGTYHQLGRVAEERSDFTTAEGLYKKALGAFVKLNDEYSASVVKNSMKRLIENKGADIEQCD